MSTVLWRLLPLFSGEQNHRLLAIAPETAAHWSKPHAWKPSNPNSSEPQWAS